MLDGLSYGHLGSLAYPARDLPRAEADRRAAIVRAAEDLVFDTRHERNRYLDAALTCPDGPEQDRMMALAESAEKRLAAAVKARRYLPRGW